MKVSDILRHDDYVEHIHGLTGQVYSESIVTDGDDEYLALPVRNVRARIEPNTFDAGDALRVSYQVSINGGESWCNERATLIGDRAVRIAQLAALGIVATDH